MRRGRRLESQCAALGAKDSSRVLRWTGLFAVAVAVVGFAITSLALTVGSHAIDFLGVVYNRDGTSTWTYSVASGRKPAISHWVLELDPAILGAANVVRCSGRYEVNTDPTTGVYGLKFDDGYGDNESRVVTFTLDRWYGETSTTVAVKAGKNVASGAPLPGPGPQMSVPNAPPVAVDDEAATDENEPIQVDVLANDADADGALARTTVSISRMPSRGMASVDAATGVVTYVPAGGLCGADEFRYRVADDDGAVSSEAVVRIAIVCNEPPAAAEDVATTDESTAVAIPVLGNDRDGDGSLDRATVSLVRSPSFGSCDVHAATGVVTYTPAVGSCGDDVFEYTVRDDDGATSAPARVTVSVLCSDPPLAIDDLYGVAEGATLSVPPVGILANDKETPGRPLHAVLITGVAHGVLILQGDGSFAYTHDGTETRDDSFTYAADDGRKSSNLATVRLVVSPGNDAPDAVDDQAATEEDLAVSIDVLANDRDPDGDVLSVDWVGAPAHGRATNLGTRIAYAPDPEFYGVDAFAYGVSDGHGGTAQATATVNVTGVNDLPVAQPDNASTREDAPVVVDVVANDRDSDGDGLSVLSVTQPTSGSATGSGTNVTYAPDPDFHGTDTFTYTVSDGRGGEASTVVTVIVTAENDMPQLFGGEVTTDEDVALAISVLTTAWDPDGDPLRLDGVSSPSHGTATIAGDVVVYAPAPGFFGDDAFGYFVSDGRGGQADATIVVRVLPVNDDPLAQNDSATTGEGALIEIAVLANDTDPDGDPLTVEAVGSPENGTASIAGLLVAYMPSAGFSGVDAFTYTVSDGRGATATARVVVNVATSNRPPVAVGGHIEMDEGTAVSVAVLENDTDPDGDPLVLESVSAPQNGSIVRDGDVVIYTPYRGYHGSDSFEYTATDGRGGVSSASITFTIRAVNDAPVARDDAAATRENVAVRIAVLANDADPDDDLLAVEWASPPANGTATVEGGTVVYMPRLGFSGADEFAYGVSDGRGATGTARVTVFVEDVNAAPIAADDVVSTLEDVPVAIAVLANDVDPDGDALTIELTSAPRRGVAAVSGTTVLYSPSSDTFGEDEFSYAVTDGRGGRAEAVVRIRVSSVNDLPVAQDDAAVTHEGVAVEIGVVQNDRDPDGDTLSVQAVQQPGHGTVANQGTRTVYTPADGWSGTDVFTYTVADGRGGSATARVTVTVLAVNHDPLAQDDSAAGQASEMITINVLANDSDPDGDFLLVQAMDDPQNGTVVNGRTSISYIPNDGFSGIDSFTYIVSDGNGGSSSAAVTVAVAEPNAQPVARDDSGATDEGVTLSLAVLGNDADPDGDPLRVESVGRPTMGRAWHDGVSVLYRPYVGTSGVDVFTYTVTDERGGTATASVLVAILAVNDAPTAQDDSATTDRGAPVSISVIANDSDDSGDTPVLVSIGTAQHGTATIVGGALLYTPESGFVGTDTVTYVVRDAEGLTAEATVTIGVADVAGGGGASPGTCEGRVILNEIAWAGSAADIGDEWIELRNLGTTPVDLTGWTVQWRRTRPATPEEAAWKTVELAGVLGAAVVSACDAAPRDEGGDVRVSPRDAGSWDIGYALARGEPGYYLIERTRDSAVYDLPADVLYDTGRSPVYSLSDAGEVLVLVNAEGDIVDTANASNVGRDAWVAGSAGAFGSMERIDPLGPDVPENWSTNVGVVAVGQDAQKHPLRGTPGGVNAPRVETLYAQSGATPVQVRAGEPVVVTFTLPRDVRRATGWPWIVATRPGLADAAGAGGEASTCSFSGQALSGGDAYRLEIGTGSAAPGVHVFWIVYGSGKGLLVPVLLTP